MGDPKYKEGNLVRLVIKNRSYTDDGFQTVGTYGVPDLSCALVYSKIDTWTYPSCNDFHGETSLVRHGDLATIVSYVGRPFNIMSTPTWEHYDVYEVLISGLIRSVFSYNLEPSSTYFKKI